MIAGVLLFDLESGNLLFHKKFLENFGAIGIDDPFKLALQLYVLQTFGNSVVGNLTLFSDVSLRTIYPADAKIFFQKKARSEIKANPYPPGEGQHTAAQSPQEEGQHKHPKEAPVSTNGISGGKEEDSSGQSGPSVCRNELKPEPCNKVENWDTRIDVNEEADQQPRTTPQPIEGNNADRTAQPMEGSHNARGGISRETSKILQEPEERKCLVVCGGDIELRNSLLDALEWELYRQCGGTPHHPAIEPIPLQEIIGTERKPPKLNNLAGDDKHADTSDGSTNRFDVMWKKKLFQQCLKREILNSCIEYMKRLFAEERLKSLIVNQRLLSEFNLSSARTEHANAGADGVSASSAMKSFAAPISSSSFGISASIMNAFVEASRQVLAGDSKNRALHKGVLQQGLQHRDTARTIPPSTGLPGSQQYQEDQTQALSCMDRFEWLVCLGIRHPGNLNAAISTGTYDPTTFDDEHEEEALCGSQRNSLADSQQKKFSRNSMRASSMGKIPGPRNSLSNRGAGGDLAQTKSIETQMREGMRYEWKPTNRKRSKFLTCFGADDGADHVGDAGDGNKGKDGDVGKNRKVGKDATAKKSIPPTASQAATAAATDIYTADLRVFEIPDVHLLETTAAYLIMDQSREGGIVKPDVTHLCSLFLQGKKLMECVGEKLMKLQIGSIHMVILSNVVLITPERIEWESKQMSKIDKFFSIFVK